MVFGSHHHQLTRCIRYRRLQPVEQPKPATWKPMQTSQSNIFNIFDIKIVSRCFDSYLFVKYQCRLDLLCTFKLHNAHDVKYQCHLDFSCTFKLYNPNDAVNMSQTTSEIKASSINMPQ